MKTQAIINTTKWLSVWFLIMGLSVNTFAQDRNNDDEVITIAEHNRHASVLGDLLVKFNDNTTLQINQTRGQFSTGIPAVDAVLSQYEVRTLEKLLPNEQPKEKHSWQCQILYRRRHSRLRLEPTLFYSDQRLSTYRRTHRGPQPTGRGGVCRTQLHRLRHGAPFRGIFRICLFRWSN